MVEPPQFIGIESVTLFEGLDQKFNSMLSPRRFIHYLNFVHSPQLCGLRLYPLRPTFRDIVAFHQAFQSPI